MTSEQKQATLAAIQDLIASKMTQQDWGMQGPQQPEDDPRLNKPQPKSDNKNQDQKQNNQGKEQKSPNSTQSQQSGGKPKHQPQIGDQGDPEIQAKEAAERAKQIEKESQEAASAAKDAGEKDLEDKNKRLEKAAGETKDAADELGDALEDKDSDGLSEAEKARIQKIQDRLNDLENQRKALDETERAVFTSAQLEADKKRRREWQDNPGQRFLTSVYRFIKDEVDSVKMASWKKPDKRYANTSIIHKGKAVNHNAPIPSLVVYFDRSGSIGQKEVDLCNQAIASLKKFEKRGELKIKVYYFANDVSSDPEMVGGGTSATQRILDHARAIHANNIIILTDSDMDHQGQFTTPLTVPGAVWFLFANGQRCYKIMEYLHGKAMTKVYDLK